MEDDIGTMLCEGCVVPWSRQIVGYCPSCGEYIFEGYTMGGECPTCGSMAKSIPDEDYKAEEVLT